MNHIALDLFLLFYNCNYECSVVSQWVYHYHSLLPNYKIYNNIALLPHKRNDYSCKKFYSVSSIKLLIAKFQLKIKVKIAGSTVTITRSCTCNFAASWVVLYLTGKSFNALKRSMSEEAIIHPRPFLQFVPCRAKLPSSSFFNIATFRRMDLRLLMQGNSIFTS